MTATLRTARFRQLHERGLFVTTVEELARLGVRRVSVGGALARTAWSGFLEAAREISECGTFSALSLATPFAEINVRFGGT